eukprot:2904580-Pyramimonas_sp.AAC.1
MPEVLQELAQQRGAHGPCGLVVELGPDVHEAHKVLAGQLGVLDLVRLLKVVQDDRDKQVHHHLPAPT